MLNRRSFFAASAAGIAGAMLPGIVPAIAAPSRAELEEAANAILDKRDEEYDWKLTHCNISKTGVTIEYFSCQAMLRREGKTWRIRGNKAVCGDTISCDMSYEPIKNP